MYINLKLFGGRGGSSGGSGKGVKEQSGFEALADGISEENLTDRQQEQVKDYLEDFLRDTAKLKKGSIEADKYNGYTTGVTLEDAKSFIKGMLNYDYDESGDENSWSVDIERTMDFWNDEVSIGVSYNTTGTKYHYYDFDEPSEFKRLEKDLKSGKIKGIVYEDGYENRVGGRGIKVVAPSESGSAFFRFDIGKLPKKKK